MFQINTPYFIAPKLEDQINEERIKPKEKNENSINLILYENNQIRKVISEGDIQMFKALSYAMFFTTTYKNTIQNICNHHLLTLIRFNNLSEKLLVFKNNMLLYRDFCHNPCDNQIFERAMMELVSLVFKVRIIIYTVTEDLYFTSIIINNRFEKTIQLFKLNGHFDVLYDKQKVDGIKISQDLIFEEILKNKFGGDRIDFNVWLSQNPDPQLADFLLNMQMTNELKIKSRHKKSLSDNFNVSHEQMQEEQKKYYEMFSNLKDPEEFFQKISPSSKSRFVKDFHKNNDDVKLTENNHNDKNLTLDYFSNSLALKNYNISPSNITSLNNSFTKVNLDDTGKNYKNNSKSLFFNEVDINNPDTIVAQSKNSKSPIYYVGTTPPGLTPKKTPKESPNMQKFNEELKYHEELFENSKNESEVVQEKTYRKNLEFNVQTGPLAYDNYNRSHFISKNSPLENDIQFAINNNTQNKSPIQPSEPKKPIIIDDTQPKIRKTGRLKFFDENKSYGFIVMDEDGSDIFVHYDDLCRAGVSKEILRSAKHGNLVRFSFLCMIYLGKYNKSKKAVELEMII